MASRWKAYLPTFRWGRFRLCHESMDGAYMPIRITQIVGGKWWSLSLTRTAPARKAEMPPFAEVLAAMTRAMATNVRDWGTDRMDAFLWGVLLGWDCDEQHEHDEIDCSPGAMDEIAARHGWDTQQIERVRRFHRAVLAAAGQAPTNSGS